jgi:hypothetical protein
MSFVKLVFAFIAVGGAGYAIFKFDKDGPLWLKVVTISVMVPRGGLHLAEQENPIPRPIPRRLRAAMRSCDARPLNAG